MSFRDMLRPGGKRLELYRKRWSETDDPLVAEARSQTLAIQQLQLWLRLAYSALAVAVLLGYWGFVDGHSTVAGVIGCILGLLSLFIVIVLRTGIANGRKNVEAMLSELESRSNGGSKETS